MKHIVPLSSIILGITLFFMSYYFGSFDPNKEGLGQNGNVLKIGMPNSFDMNPSSVLSIQASASK